MRKRLKTPATLTSAPGRPRRFAARSCARRGAILGVLAAHGVYVITGEYTAEANKRLIEFIARDVEVTGEITERAGRRTIRIRDIRLKSAA